MTDSSGSMSRKTFVLDTNILIHNPYAVFTFDEHPRVIPMPVLEELDKLKTEPSDRGRQARIASRVLDCLIEEKGMERSDSGVFINLNGDSGQGPIIFTSALYGRERPWPPAMAMLDPGSKDNQILAVAHFLQEECSGRIDESPDDQSAESRRVILVTNDINLRVKAAAIGVAAEGYQYDAVVRDSDIMPTGLLINDNEEGKSIWELYDHSLHKNEPNGKVYYCFYEYSEDWLPGMLIHCSHSNVDLMIVGRGEDEDGQPGMIVRTLVNHYGQRTVFGVSARDRMQNFAFNCLLDPNIDITSIAGAAGTGKTYLAMAAALHLLTDRKTSKIYHKIIITRETTTMSDSEEIGFLPGNEEEKMAPWMGGFVDNLKKLIGNHKDGALSLETLMEEKVEMRSIGLMRGRSINNAIVVLDEVQNLTAKQVQSLTSRAGENTKVIMLGNLGQIDNPYLTMGNSGLSVLVDKLKDWEHSAHLVLEKVERSRLAEKIEAVFS